MQEVKVYDGENYQRTKRWYINFATFFIFFTLLLIFVGNILGAVLLFLFLGGYILFSLTSTAIISLKVDDEFLYIGPKHYSLARVQGFLLEVDKDERVKNIILLINNQKYIHTFMDDLDKARDFVMKLSETVPMLDNYPQSNIDKLVRLFKL